MGDKISITHEGNFEVSRRPKMQIGVYPAADTYAENEPELAKTYPWRPDTVTAVVIRKGDALAHAPFLLTEKEVVKLDGMVPSIGALQDGEPT